LENGKIEALLAIRDMNTTRKTVEPKPKQLYVTFDDINKAFVNVYLRQ
jgi:hypothetical protein